jgi:hypothetical protein
MIPMAKSSGVENVWDIITIQNLICLNFRKMMVARWLSFGKLYLATG